MNDDAGSDLWSRALKRARHRVRDAARDKPALSAYMARQTGFSQMTPMNDGGAPRGRGGRGHRARLAVCAAALGACAPLSAPDPDQAAFARDWRDEIVYQLLVDRFANGDASNDAGVDLDCAACWHGGDWAGVETYLDYLEALGVTAIWISPVAENADGPNGAAYHGFWPAALDRPNPHFGDLASLRALVDACHARSMKVIVDLVQNHLGPVFFYDLDGDQAFDGGAELAPPFAAAGLSAAPIFFAPDAVSPAFFRDAERYHRKGQVTDPGDAAQILTADFPGGLRDLDTSQPEVRAALVDVVLDWLDAVPFDGIRYDAAKHVDDQAWDVMLAAVREHARPEAAFDDGLLQLAEVFDGDENTLARYTGPGRFDAVLNFAARFALYEGVFQDGGPTARVFEHHRDKEAAFDREAPAGGVGVAPSQLLFNFLDNHDLPRFLSDAAPGVGALHAALGYLLLSDGVPVIYYGTEQDFAGGADPANREDLATSAYAMDGETFAWIARLCALRREAAVWRRGEWQAVWTTEHVGEESDAGVLAFERTLGAERVLVAINARDTPRRTRYLEQRMQVGFAPGTRLRDPLDEAFAEITVPDDARLDLELPPHAVRVLAPAP